MYNLKIPPIFLVGMVCIFSEKNREANKLPIYYVHTAAYLCREFYFNSFNSHVKAIKYLTDAHLQFKKSRIKILYLSITALSGHITSPFR